MAWVGLGPAQWTYVRLWSVHRKTVQPSAQRGLLVRLILASQFHHSYESQTDSD